MSSKPNRTYHNQMKLSIAALLSELPRFASAAIAVVGTGAVIEWLDLLESFKNVINALMIMLLSKKLRRDLRNKYNYGVVKIEAAATVICLAMTAAGLMGVTVFSVFGIIYPEKPSELLLYVVFLKIINVWIDIFFLHHQKSIRKNGGGSIANAEVVRWTETTVFDLTAFISLFICWFFRNYKFSWYISPVISIILAVFFFIEALGLIKNSVFVLTDHSLSREKQHIITRALKSCSDEYRELVSIKSRLSGDTVVIDLDISFDDDTSFADMKAFLKKITDNICSEIPDSRVSIVISGNYKLSENK